jgi:hypothetical protein
MVAECLFDTEQSQEYLAQPYQIMLRAPIAPSYYSRTFALGLIRQVEFGPS